MPKNAIASASMLEADERVMLVLTRLDLAGYQSYHDV